MNEISMAERSRKAGNTMRVRKETSVQAVTDFICQYAPKGAVGHPGNDCMTWLLKPTNKGGPTMARVIVHDDAAHIYEAAWEAAWAITKAKRDQEYAEIDAFIAKDTQP